MDKTRSGVDHFDEAAATWEKNPRRVALARGVADAILTRVNLTKTMHAMEFGCGTGLISMALAPFLKSILAVDTSARMLDMLAQKVKQNTIDNITTGLFDLTNNELPDDRFDLIFSSMALHHIKDINALLGILKGLLNPGGIIAIADLDTEDGGFHSDVPDVFHFGFDRNVLADYLKKMGFTSVTTSTAHIMTKESAISKQDDDFPVFLVTAEKPDRTDSLKDRGK